MTPIGVVHGGRDVPEDDDWGQSRAWIDLDPARFDAEALTGLDAFSHVEVIYVFDEVTDDQIVTGARHRAATPPGPRSGSSPRAANTASPTGRGKS